MNELQEPLIESANLAPAEIETRGDRWKARLKRWAVDALTVFAVFLAVSIFQQRAHHRGLLPSFDLPKLGGGRVQSESMVGHPTILVFFAPWCGVCAANEDAIDWAQSILGERVRVVHVALSYRQVSEVQQFLGDRADRSTVILGNNALANAFGVRSFPTYYFVDSSGKIHASATGYTTSVGLVARALMPF